MASELEQKLAEILGGKAFYTLDLATCDLCKKQYTIDLRAPDEIGECPNNDYGCGLLLPDEQKSTERIPRPLPELVDMAEERLCKAAHLRIDWFKPGGTWKVLWWVIGEYGETEGLGSGENRDKMLACAEAALQALEKIREKDNGEK